MTNKIPYQYRRFCNNPDVRDCDYVIHRDCPGTCGYVTEILGLGIGAMDKETAKGLEKKIVFDGIVAYEEDEITKDKE